MNTPPLLAGTYAAAILLPLVLATGFALPRVRAALGALVPWAGAPALLVALAPPHTSALHLEGLLLGVRLGLDETGRGFLFLTALLWTVAARFAQGYLTAPVDRARFSFFWLLAMAGNLTLVLAEDMLSFYSGFALMSFASYGLVIHNGDVEALRAGRVYLALVVVGELLLFAGLVMRVGATGEIAMAPRGSATDSPLAALLLLAGFGIKAGALPLHVWLPLAHPAAPVPASAVLSGAMIKAGLLGWLRFLPDGAIAGGDLAAPLVAAGLAAAFFGAAVGVLQSNPKTVLAYSSISQMGLITTGVGAALFSPELASDAVAAVTLYALHHGLAKGALFLGVGISGAAKARLERRLLIAGLLLPALALAGAPLTSGAVAKIALKASLAELPAPWPAWLDTLLPLAAVGTTLLMARFLLLLFPLRGERAAEHLSAAGAHASRGAALWSSWAILLLAVAAVVWLWPGSGRATDKALSTAMLWPLIWPVATGALLTWLAVLVARRRASQRWPSVPAGDLLIVVERVLAALRATWSSSAARALSGWRDGFRAAFQSGFRSVPVDRVLSEAEPRLRAWPSAGLLLTLFATALWIALL